MTTTNTNAKPETQIAKAKALAEEIQARRDNMLKSIRVFFLRNPNGYPVACVATLVNDPDKKDASVAMFTVSTCSPRDQFLKSMGKMVATARLLKYKGVDMVPFGPGLHRAIAAKIARTQGYPMRTRKAAAHWLTTHPPVDHTRTISDAIASTHEDSDAIKSHGGAA